MNLSIFPADPKATYLAAKPEIDAAIQRVLMSGVYILGPELAAFETELASYVGAKGAVGVANGTDAIELALRACGIGPGDKVATVANTVTATVSAIVATGAEPAYVEIEDDTMLMSAAALEARLLEPDGGSIKAVVPVHLYGLPCDMPSIMAIAQRQGLKVVEDCAQAQGSLVGGIMAGNWGDLAAFSFYPTKNLGALGDAGAVVGNSPALLDRVRRLRQYGWTTRYVSVEHGRNSRLDEIQAAILRVRLTRLTNENEHRDCLARKYLSELSGTCLRLPVVPRGRTHCWHQFVIRTELRDVLKTRLLDFGIHSAILYPTPVYWQPAYETEASTKSAALLPSTETACKNVLSLPIHVGLTQSDLTIIIAALKRGLN